MGILSYVQQKAVIPVIRLVASSTTAPSPDEKLQIPSRDPGRTIPVHVYRPSAEREPGKPTPVLVNFHGSGFILSLHGSDDEFARYVARETGNYTVLDVGYRLAPEHPYPAAVNDAEDAIKWVLSKPDLFDLSKLSLSGFSAGGNLALVASSALFPKQTFDNAIAIYPPTDLAKDPSTKTPPDTSGKPIPSWLCNIFDDAYMPPGVDRKGPTVSPFYTDGERFPDKLLIITCACDSLCLETEALADKIRAVPGKSVVSKRMDGCNHAWDKSCNPGSMQEKAKNDAYNLVVKTLQG